MYTLVLKATRIGRFKEDTAPSSALILPYFGIRFGIASRLVPRPLEQRREAVLRCLSMHGGACRSDRFNLRRCNAESHCDWPGGQG